MGVRSVGLWLRAHCSLGGWPITFQDISAATDHLRVIAPAHSLDLSRVVAVGHSAGGHLALWMAARKKLPKGSLVYSDDPLPIRGVVALAPLADLETAIRDSVCDDTAKQLMGTTPQENPHIFEEASIPHLLPLQIPQVYIQGKQDIYVPPAYTEQFLHQVRKSDESNQTYQLLDQAGHFELVAPSTPAGEKVVWEIQKLVSRLI